MAYFSHPVQRADVTRKIFEEFESFPFDPELEEHKAPMRSRIVRILEEADLPPILERKINLSNRMRDPIARAKKYLQASCSVPPETLSAVLVHVCRGVNLIFYDEYIKTELQHHLAPYCASKPAPRQWGLASIFYWDPDWGRRFYYFWRNAIEKNGDEHFKNRVLPRLPEDWQKSYKMKKTFVICPYRWGEMADAEIAATLANLKKPYNPAEKIWAFGAIPKWIGENQHALWGKSFWGWWRAHVENEGDEEFRAHILPLLPAKWQAKFAPLHSTAIHWLKMSDTEIADLLNGLFRPYGLKRWGLGAVHEWFDAESGKKLGVRFALFWRRTVERQGDSEFRRRILPHLHPDLRVRYRPIGYEITFCSTPSEDDRLQAEQTDDMDELHELAHQGNRLAFDRLKDLLRLHLQCSAPDCECPDEVLDRIIHMHMPVFGKIERYARSSVRALFRYAFYVPMDKKFSPPETEDIAVGEMDQNISIRALIAFLRNACAPPETITQVFDMLLDDIPLTTLMKNPDADIARTAKLVSGFKR